MQKNIDEILPLCKLLWPPLFLPNKLSFITFNSLAALQLILTYKMSKKGIFNYRHKPFTSAFYFLGSAFFLKNTYKCIYTFYKISEPD